MSSADTHDIHKEVKRYILVFVALAALTVVTVGVSYLKLGVVGGVILALIIATIKGSLVACYFMHLISEQKLIYAVLIMTVVFFIVLFLLPIFGFYDTLVGTEHVT